eukprot:TRINITY_DN12393_c0_g1_i4.p1 TRINITY_DN12393_c0_g1~~TRINITY_DN12393_c0_g1_i4.p1  ORF type:complete len:217 (+),score=56.34 TRINITY_DN12393_c0_g1_i4:155-805(+)
MVGSRDRYWYKLKSDMLEGYGDDLDLVVLGGYRGTGNKRGGKIAEFLLGTAVWGPESTSEPTAWDTFAKVGTGYTEDELAMLMDKIESKFVEYDHSRPPEHFPVDVRFQKNRVHEGMREWRPKGDDIPHVWIDPRKSIILQTHAFEVVESEVFSATWGSQDLLGLKSTPHIGVTLRFPRALSLIHISEPTRLLSISYAVFCLKKKKKTNQITITDS